MQRRRCCRECHLALLLENHVASMLWAKQTTFLDVPELAWPEKEALPDSVAAWPLQVSRHARIARQTAVFVHTVQQRWVV